MPGFGLSMGITITMLSFVVILPIGALLLKGAAFGPGEVWRVVNTERTWAALYLSFRLSLFAALFNLVFGVLLAWVLVRYRFPGRSLLNAAVDLPFALPTAVAGIALTALYAPNGAFGSLAKGFGVQIAYTQLGILIALIFVGLPFVTRTVQPVIEEIEREAIVSMLRRYNGHRQKTARALGIGVRTLGLKLKKWKQQKLVADTL